MPYYLFYDEAYEEAPTSSSELDDELQQDLQEQQEYFDLLMQQEHGVLPLEDGGATDVPPSGELNNSEIQAGETYTYEPATVSFSREQLDLIPRRAFQILQEHGVTAVRCRYNGGGDEGFATFDTAIIDGRIVPLQDLAQRLARSPLGDVVEQTPGSPSHNFGHYTRDESTRATLDWLAFALASHLLGEGYGTGDYSLFGAFRADFKTGQIVDEEVVEQGMNNCDEPDSDEPEMRNTST